MHVASIHTECSIRVMRINVGPFQTATVGSLTARAFSLALVGVAVWRCGLYRKITEDLRNFFTMAEAIEQPFFAASE